MDKKRYETKDLANTLSDLRNKALRELTEEAKKIPGSKVDGGVLVADSAWREAGLGRGIVDNNDGEPIDDYTSNRMREAAGIIGLLSKFTMETTLINLLNYAKGELQNNPPKARHWAIFITDIEKLSAWHKTFLAD